LNTAAYISINLLLFSSWHIFLFRKRDILPFIDRVTGALVLCLTQIILTELLLGVLFRSLYAVPLFLLNLSISSVVLAGALFHGKMGHEENIKPFVSGILNELNDRTIRLAGIIKKDFILLLLIVLFSITMCWAIFLGYLFPSYAWDAIWYHLPMAGYIIQSGAIQENPVFSMITQFMNIFPKNAELLFIWNIIFLRSDVIADLGQLLFVIIGIFAVYGIAVKINISGRNAIYSALLFFFAPITILQVTTNYIDVTVSALFLAAINFLLHSNPSSRQSRVPSSLPVLLAGLATGILLGAKGSGPLFVIVLSAFFWAQEMVKGRPVLGIKPYLLYFAVPAILIGGYWYIKNWILYGSPVYPMEVSVFNVTIFKGLYKEFIEPLPPVFEGLSPVKRILYVWMERVEYYFYDSRVSGFGPLWFVLFLPGLLFSIVYALVKRRYGFLSVSAVLFVTFLIHTRNWNSRYVIFLFGSGVLSFGLMLDYFGKRGNVLKIIALALAGYTAFTANSPCVMPLQIKKFMHLPANERTLAQHNAFSIDLHARQEYGYWIWLGRNISGGDVLAHTFEPLFLTPLWNSAFSNKVAYIKADHYNEWLKMLRHSNTTHVLIRRNSEEDKWIDREEKARSSLGWLGRLKERFRTVYADENYKVLKFNKDEG